MILTLPWKKATSRPQGLSGIETTSAQTGSKSNNTQYECESQKASRPERGSGTLKGGDIKSAKFESEWRTVDRF